MASATNAKVKKSNDQLRALITEAGWTLELAAHSVNGVAAENGHHIRTNRSGVSYWLNGGKINPATALFLAEALSRRLKRFVTVAEIGYGEAEDDVQCALPVDPILGLRRLGRADVDRRGFVGGVVYSLAALALPLDEITEHAQRAAAAAAGKPIGWSEVESATTILHAFDAADEKLGGGHGRSALVEYLTTDVAVFLRAPATAEVHGAMFSVATQLAFLVGWKAHDLMLEGLAQRYYLYALELAKEASDPGLAGYVTRILAHQAFDLGHSQHCADLADRSTELVRGHTDPHTLGVFELTRARAHGILGERRQAAAALARAEHADASSGDGDTRPSWVKMRSNRGQFHSHYAKTLLDIGDYEHAEHHFSLAHNQRDKETHALIAGLSQAWLAEAQFKRGKLSDALTNWAGAKQRYEGIQSQRATQTLKDMRSMLMPLRTRKIREVDALLAS